MDRPVELQAILSEVRRRWTRRSLLRAGTLGALATAVVVLSGWGTTISVAREGLPLLTVAIVVLLVSAFAIVRAFWAARGRPTDHQVARLIEERDGELDDVLVTAVDYEARSDASPRMRQALLGDAARALTSRNLPHELDRVISRDAVHRAAWRALAAALVLAVAAAGFAPAVSRASRVAAAYLFPARLAVEVAPGTTKVRAGQSLTITARATGLSGEVIPTLNLAVGDRTRSVRMTPTSEPGVFGLAIDKVTASFAYDVTAANARSDSYTVTVIRPPVVRQIDLHYEFPKGLGLDPRTDEDSGDIYGPLGTRVRLSISADKPIASASLVLGDGKKVPLTVNGDTLEGALTIDDDASYRVALADTDGLENAGDIEYFIRTLEDRPPDVRIMRPASDKKVSPLEEVQIEARADDDFGIASLDLVFQAPDGKERAVPLKGIRGGLTAAGLHTVFMEELKVQPGDFVSYYARARDVARGRRSSEARSDIFFLEVKPFEEEFVAVQSQSMGQGAGMQAGGLEGLAEAQKQLIVATWNLDARARRAQGAPSQQDIKAVSKAQAELRERAVQASAQGLRMNDPRVRRRTSAPAPGDDPIGKAVEAMGRAVAELDKSSTTGALPHEREALNQLLRAEAENRRRQVTRSQQAGGGGGQNRAEADLSSLFDQELRKRQSTNYETPNSTEERQENKQQNPLDQIRDLARRQDALTRQQQELARNRDRMDAEELKRQLERLTREQNELRQQAQQLAQQMQNGQRSESQASQNNQNSAGQSQGGNQNGGRSAQGQQESRRLREISEDMRNAAAGAQRQDLEQAAQSASRASERLRDLEGQMQAARPDERRRALGDLQLESRQLADEQRRLANESGRTTRGDSGDDARRRLAAEQERLGERAERLQDRVKNLSRSGQGDRNERRATEDAAREFDNQRIAERMREAADTIRKGESGGDTRQQELAKSLDRVADRLGDASGNRNADSRRQSEQLAKTQELRDTLQQIDRSVEQLRRESDASSQSQGRPQPGQGVQRGGSSGGNGRAEELQREVNERMRQAERLANEIRRETGMAANPEAEWWRSFSAPGTEAFKQDFSRWESLKKNLLIALEGVETKVSDELRARENDQRLNAGGHETVSEAYRDLVEKYYRSLAAPRRPQ
jgi:hypothetical protein